MNGRPLIVLSEHDFSYQAIKDEGYDIDCPYRGNRMPLRLLREVFFRFRLPGKSIWYNKRVNKNAKSVIVYDALITREYMFWLRKHNINSQIIYLYTDPVDKAIRPEQLPDKICEKWSSDDQDCEKYGLKKTCDGGYSRLWKVEKEEKKWEIFYIGRDKGRLDGLLKLKEEFELLGLSANFYITAYHRYQKYNNPIYQPLVPYSEVLKMLGKSRAILHLVEGGQKGITIRVLESIIHGIKLITDNAYLREMEIYRPNNIFILGQDDLKKLPIFLNAPFEPYDREYIESLYFNNLMDCLIGDEHKL